MKEEDKPFEERRDSIRYAGRVFDLCFSQNALISFKLKGFPNVCAIKTALVFSDKAAGRFTRELEEALKEYLGIKYVGLVNSGSSANLLAFQALTSPLLDDSLLPLSYDVPDKNWMYRYPPMFPFFW